MQNRRKCWNCKYQSLTTDVIPGRHLHKCPHCGMESYQFIVEQLDRAAGTPYFAHSLKMVTRANRERAHLYTLGLYKSDINKRTVDKLDAYIPDR